MLDVADVGIPNIIVQTETNNELYTNHWKQ